MADINNGNNLPKGQTSLCISKTSLETNFTFRKAKNFTLLELQFTDKISPFPTHYSRGGQAMRDKREENGAAQMAWQLFEKTGSISYYMLYYDILRKK